MYFVITLVLSYTPQSYVVIIKKPTSLIISNLREIANTSESSSSRCHVFVTIALTGPTVLKHESWVSLFLAKGFSSNFPLNDLCEPVKAAELSMAISTPEPLKIRLGKLWS